MNNYSERLSLTLPASLLPIASAISRALDPDLGGADSWTRLIVGYDADEQPIYGDTISTNPPCTPEFLEKAQYMLANPDALHAAVAADYAARWPEFTPPTLAECYEFCAGVINVEPTNVNQA